MPINSIAGPMARSASTKASGEYSPPLDKTEEEKKEESQRVGGKTQLSLDDFYKLMAVQLQNQDMSNPMDNSEMMNQMVQMAMVEAMSTFTDLSVTTYATNLLGKEVEVYDIVDGKPVTKTGIVSGVNLSGDVRVYLDGDKTAYGIGNVMHVGKQPPKDEDDGAAGDGDTPTGPDAPGDGGTAGPDSSEGIGGPGDASGNGDSGAAARSSYQGPAAGVNAKPGTGNKPGPDEDTTLDSPDINAITGMV